MCIHSKLKSSRWYQKCPHTFFEITTTDNFLGKNNVKKFWGRDAFKSLAASVLLSLGEGRQSRDIRSGHSCRSLPPVLIMQMPSFKLIYLVLVIHHYWRSLAACLLILKLFRGWKVSGLFVNQPQFLVNIFKEFNASSLQNCSGARDCLWTSYNLFIILNINGQITITR